MQMIGWVVGYRQRMCDDIFQRLDKRIKRWVWENPMWFELDWFQNEVNANGVCMYGQHSRI